MEEPDEVDIDEIERQTMSEEELRRYYRERSGDESLWAETPTRARVRRDRGALFSLRLPTEELESLRQEAERSDTTVSALLRDGAKLLVQHRQAPDSIPSRISAELYRRVVASRPLIETILEEDQDVDDCLNLLIELGLERVLTDIVGTADGTTLVKAMVQLAARAPETVYGYTVEMLKLGVEMNAEGAEPETPKDRAVESPPDSPRASNLLMFEALSRKSRERIERHSGTKAP